MSIPHFPANKANIMYLYATVNYLAKTISNVPAKCKKKCSMVNEMLVELSTCGCWSSRENNNEKSKIIISFMWLLSSL